MVEEAFQQFLSYLPPSVKTEAENLVMDVRTKTLSDKFVEAATSPEDLMLKTLEGFPTSTIALLGVFKKFTDPEDLEDMPDFISRTSSSERFLLFLNFDIQPELDRKALVVAYLREFCNYLLVRSGEVGELESHSGACLRTYDMTLPQDNLSPLEEMRALVQKRYQDIPLTLCETCAPKLVKGLMTLSASSTTKPREESRGTGTTPSQGKTPTTPTPKTPPSIVTQQGLDWYDPEAKFPPLSPIDKKKIAEVMGELGIREPTHDEEYLEARERYLKGKISVHVFKHTAKRKAY